WSLGGVTRPGGIAYAPAPARAHRKATAKDSPVLLMLTIAWQEYPLHGPIASDRPLQRSQARLPGETPMAILGPYGFVLEVPDLETGIRFYTDAGLNAQRDGNVVRFRCDGQDRDCITLLGGSPRKRIHHLILRADPQQLGAVRNAIPDLGGKVIEA